MVYFQEAEQQLRQAKSKLPFQPFDSGKQTSTHHANYQSMIVEQMFAFRCERTLLRHPHTAQCHQRNGQTLTWWPNLGFSLMATVDVALQINLTQACCP